MIHVDCGSGRGSRDGFSRRDFLQIGTLGLGGLTLGGLRSVEAAASSASSFVRGKSIVLLYLSGGASHIETFDPKMTAPEGVRSITGEVLTNVPGVTFGGTFERLAKHADKLAVVRSFTHPVGGHVQAHSHVLSGGLDEDGNQQRGFSMGSAYARIRGANHPENGLPTYALLTEEEIDSQYRNERGRIQRGSWPGSLGPTFAPFGQSIGWKPETPQTDTSKKKSTGNPLADSMTLNIPREALEDRLALLHAVDRIDRRLDATGTMDAVDKFSAQAVDLLLGGAADAFDVTKEDPRLIQKYDTSHIQIGKKVFRPSTLGKQFLLARRLCEAGCGFVTIHSAGWDMHADGNNPGMLAGMDMLGRSLDQALSAFLEDLQQRGLSDDVLFVLTGDFGRTPKINARGGRDHWPRLCTLAFAGGGLKMGQVVGQSARGADVPASEPIGPQNLMATIMHTLFDVGQVRVQTALPQTLLKQLEQAEPIRQL